jgi:chaperonin GroEL (HSP60 family)
MTSRFWLQGLQAIGASCKTLLGPKRNVKAVLNSKDTTFLVEDTLALLDALDIEHPIAQLLLDVCNGQQKACGNGCATLVNMAAGWSRTVQTLIEQVVVDTLSIFIMWLHSDV